MPRINKRSVDAAKPDKERDIVLWDDTLHGFGLRVKPSGTKTYILQYRNTEGRSRRYTIGQHGKLTPEQAETEAKRLFGLIAVGRDPASEKQDLGKEATFADLAAKYLEIHLPHKKARSAHEDRRMLKQYITPVLGTRKVYAITQDDIEGIHGKLKDHPYQANRVLALLSKMFTLAEAWKVRPQHSNPCRYVEKFKEEKRERYLSERELAWVGRAIAKAEAGDDPKMAVSESAGLALRLLLLTGARLNEILTLKWEYLDLEKGVAVLPDTKTEKNKRLMLPAPALMLLTRDPQPQAGWVILGATKDKHLYDLKGPWSRVKSLVDALQDKEEADGRLKPTDRVDISGVRIHDFRHSFASVGVSGGMTLPLVGALLGHTQAATTQRYAHLAADPLKAAADRIGGEIAARLEGRKLADVVDMHSSQGRN